MSGQSTITRQGELIPAVVADRLRRLRREAGFNRDALARETGISRRSIVMHELGNVAGIRADFLCRYADVFGVSTDYILGRTDERSGSDG
jgi:transcriptional regulator with XRE-family HTH domain